MARPLCPSLILLTLWSFFCSPFLNTIFHFIVQTGFLCIPDWSCSCDGNALASQVLELQVFTSVFDWLFNLSYVFIYLSYLYPDILFYLCEIYFTCMSVSSAYMSAHHLCVWCPQEPEEGIQSLGAGTTDGCKPPRECRESNLSPLEEQPLLLTTEPFPQSYLLIF